MQCKQFYLLRIHTFLHEFTSTVGKQRTNKKITHTKYLPLCTVGVQYCMLGKINMWVTLVILIFISYVAITVLSHVSLALLSMINQCNPWKMDAWYWHKKFFSTLNSQQYLLFPERKLSSFVTLHTLWMVTHDQIWITWKMATLHYSTSLI